jgi:hypothetical protein
MSTSNSTPSSKKRIVKDYENLPEEIISRVKAEYPYGFADNLVSFTNKEGKRVSALPFETDEIYYLIRMTQQEAREIVADDDDYDDEGNLRSDYNVDDISEEDEPSDNNDPYDEF